MCLSDLQLVHNFSIFNRFGKVEYHDPVDLTFQDLDQAVNIKHGCIEVYPDEEGQVYYLNKPRVGAKMAGL